MSQPHTPTQPATRDDACSTRERGEGRGTRACAMNERDHRHMSTNLTTLADLTPCAAARHGSAEFLVLWSSRHTVRTISFAEFEQYVAVAMHHIQRALSSIETPPRGCRVALLAHASTDALAMSLAVPSISAVLVQLNWRQPDSVLATMLSGLQCTVLIAGWGFASKARRLRAQSCVEMVLLIDGEDQISSKGEAEPSGESGHSGDDDAVRLSCNPNRLLSSNPDVAAEALAAFAAATKAGSSSTTSSTRPKPSDVAAVMFTSGTSALPKPVPLTHDGLLWSCRAKRHAERTVLGVRDDEHRGTLAFLPTFHVIGFTNNFLYNLLAGVRCMVHADAAVVPMSSRLLLRACDELRPSILDTVPALLQSICTSSGSSESSGSSSSGSSGGGQASGSGRRGSPSICMLAETDAAVLRRCSAVLYGGAPLSAATIHAFRACGVALYSQYGQTELGGMVLLGDGAGQAGSMRPLEGITISLRPTGVAERSGVGAGGSGATEGSGHDGELILTGVGSLTPGYWKLETPTSLKPREDLARADSSSADSSASAASCALTSSSASTSAAISTSAATSTSAAISTSAATSASAATSTTAVPLGNAHSHPTASSTREWATGDIFTQASDGQLTHVCRRDEMLLHTSGEMTNPIAVEACVLPRLLFACAEAGLSGSGSSTRVADCCLFGQGKPVPALVIELDACAPWLSACGDGGKGGKADDGGKGGNDGGDGGDGDGNRGNSGGGGVEACGATKDRGRGDGDNRTGTGTGRGGTTLDGVPLVDLEGAALRDALLLALSEAASSIPAYSCPPPGLVILVHPTQHTPLPRTAKGGCVRSAIERRFAQYVDELLRRSASEGRMEGGAAEEAGSAEFDDDVDGPTDAYGVGDACQSGEYGEDGDGGGSGSGGARKSAGRGRRRHPADSLGLASLSQMRHHGRRRADDAVRVLSADEVAADTLVQHLKVFLLFAVVLRHLQRFTVRTCHAWHKVGPDHVVICVANNVLQTGAAEGLALLSGAALSGRVLQWSEVASPLVLILAFRELFHPLLELLVAYRTDIGTAHLWFVLMVAFGRLLCLPLSRLARWRRWRTILRSDGDSATSARAASRLRAAFALTLLAWRLLLAPVHIGCHGHPLLRHLLFFFFYGDRNYLQIVHNLPLFLIGYAHADLRALGSRNLLASPTARRLWQLARTSTHIRISMKASLVAASFVADPLVGGIFNRKTRMLEDQPLLAYGRAALRVGALATLLPHRPTPITAAGRTQLLAYLLHDAVFSVAAHGLKPALPSLTHLAALAKGAAYATGLGSVTHMDSSPAIGLGTVTFALLEFAIYASVCLSVQLALSHPSCLGMIFRWPPPMHPRCLGGSLARGRLALRQLKHYMYGGQGGRRSADTKPVAV